MFNVLRNIITTWPLNKFTAAGKLHLVRSPRFLPESMFIPKSMLYTQSVVRCPRPQSIFYIERLNRHERCLFRRYARRRAFITKTRTIISFENTTLNRLGFGGTVTGHFNSLPKQGNRGHVGQRTKAILWGMNSFPM